MNKYIWLSLMVMTLLSCREELVETTITEVQYSPPVVRVNGSVAGLVSDEQGVAVTGAKVRIGSHEQTSGAGGYFVFKDIPLDANGTFIQVNHPGYFHASTRIFPHLNSRNYAHLQLMPKVSAGQLNAASGGTLDLPSGAKVSLPANGVAATGGLPYDGPVEVMARWLSPEAHSTADRMPGNLQGIDAQDQEQALLTYGIMAVELMSPTGESLNVADGAEATLFFPLPEALRNSAPAEIALWHFDQLSGLWREAGSAVKLDAGYEAKVGHFSFWGLAQSQNLVNLQGRLLSSSGDPLPNVCLRIFAPNLAQAGSACTDDSGVFTGRVPANEALILQILTPCGTIAQEQPIGPFSEDTDLGDVTVDSELSSSSLITGQLVDCSGAPVDNGILQICWATNCQFVWPDEDGLFSKSIVACSPGQFTVTAFDLSEVLASEPQTFDLAATVDLGEFPVCDAPIAEFVSLNYLGKNRTYLQVITYDNNGKRHITAVGSQHNLQLAVPDLEAPSSFSGEDVYFNYFEYISENGMWVLYSGECIDLDGDCLEIDLEITEYGGPGGYIRGNFSGVTQFTSSFNYFPGTLFEGEFAVKR